MLLFSDDSIGAHLLEVSLSKLRAADTGTKSELGAGSAGATSSPRHASSSEMGGAGAFEFRALEAVCGTVAALIHDDIDEIQGKLGSVRFYGVALFPWCMKEAQARIGSSPFAFGCHIDFNCGQGCTEFH